MNAAAAPRGGAGRSALRLLALVLGSQLFIPVSCIVGTGLALPHMAARDDRDMARGDAPHRDFFVAAHPGEAGKPFRLVRWTDMRPRAAATAFRVPASAARIELPAGHASYRLLSTQGREQVIELALVDNDRRSWSTYRVGPSGVTPLASRNANMSYLPEALLFGVALAVLVMLLGKWLGRRLAREST